MTKQLTALTIAACTLGVAQASAAPIQLDPVGWAAAAAGLSVVTEDFSAFATGMHPSPLTLANGSFSTTSGEAFIVSGGGVCGGADACLQAHLYDTRTFSAFPAGTTLWSVSDFFANDSRDTFRVTVLGGSGTSVFEQSGTTFWGVGDPLGLTSVTFLNRGFAGVSISNYSFDDVASAGPGLVPEPTSMLLLVTGAVGLLVKARRRKKPFSGGKAA